MNSGSDSGSGFVTHKNTFCNVEENSILTERIHCRRDGSSPGMFSTVLCILPVLDVDFESVMDV